MEVDNGQVQTSKALPNDGLVRYKRHICSAEGIEPCLGYVPLLPFMCMVIYRGSGLHWNTLPW